MRYVVWRMWYVGWRTEGAAGKRTFYIYRLLLTITEFRAAYHSTRASRYVVRRARDWSGGLPLQRPRRQGVEESRGLAIANSEVVHRRGGVHYIARIIRVAQSQ